MKDRTKSCGICGKNFDYKYGPNGELINSNHRKSCYECVPFGERPKKNYTRNLNPRSDAKRKYNFLEIQKDYDSGFTYREITAKYGICSNSISLAVRRGDLLTRNLSEASRLSVSLGRFGKREMSEEAKRNLSERQSSHNSGGRSKWFIVNGVNVQGTWERDIAIKFCEIGVDWIKVKHPVKYIDDSGNTRRYTPDFYLPQDNVYLEVKGYWWGNDKRKMELVISQHPEMNIKIIQEELYKRILYGERVW